MEGVIQGALNRLGTEVQRRKAVIENPGEWPNPSGVAPWIQAVWVNYISNALKYGGSPPTVTLFWEEVEDRPGWVRYGVIDNGPGIKIAVPDRLFEEFSRTGGEKEEGHGIGLSICRRIITRLGGEVKAENMPGGGSRFSFILKKA
jgi:signal transduction histidine kinase